jgi:hypothetical protein
MGKGRRLFLLASIAVAAWPASTAASSPQAKQVRFRATLEANIEFSHRYVRSHVDGSCTITHSGASGRRLTFASRRPSILFLDPRDGSVRGTLRPLVGQHEDRFGSVEKNSCLPYDVIGDGCMRPPEELRDGKVGVFAKRGQQVRFSTITFPSWGCGEHRDLAAALNLARGTLTRGHLLQRNTIVVSGSHETSMPSSDEIEVDSTSVAWTLRLVRVR